MKKKKAKAGANQRGDFAKRFPEVSQPGQSVRQRQSYRLRNAVASGVFTATTDCQAFPDGAGRHPVVTFVPGREGGAPVRD